MPLRIAISDPGTIAIDFEGVTPERLRGLSLDEIRRTPIGRGNREVELGELCRVEGDAADMHWQLTGDFSSVRSLGAGMTVGEIEVDENVGPHAGAGMSGGRIEVRGNAGDWLGAEMCDGAIHVRGDAGDHAGGAYVGSRRGMNGGTLLIDGNAGDEVGGRMRRGLIAVAGSVGDWLGRRMLAGSILVFGNCGQHPGASMRRGTIALLGKQRPELSPTFRWGCRAPLPVLRLLQHRLRHESFADDRRADLANAVDLYHGDLLELGRGELLMRA